MAVCDISKWQQCQRQSRRSDSDVGDNYVTVKQLGACASLGEGVQGRGRGL